MLKRDLPGLRQIVQRLGDQEGIVNVYIINPAREVRFAAHKEALGRYLSMADLGCPQCENVHTDMRKLASFTKGGAGRDLLRSVNPIRNKKPCIGCHGPLEKKSSQRHPCCRP